MPSYKTHSIHGEIIYDNINGFIDIDKEDLKTFCIGLDSLIMTDYNTFNYLHTNNVKEYFLELLKLIKHNKQLENKELIAFLYGQLDHYILDLVMHPFIYYLTEDMKNQSILTQHAILEMKIDEYIMNKYDKKDLLYYHKLTIDNQNTAFVIDKLYRNINVLNAPLKYSLGIILMVYFDTFIRRDIGILSSTIPKIINLGDIVYQDKLDEVIPYLNLDNEVWYHPETKEKFNYSFDELWDNSLILAKEMINDVNKYLYLDKNLDNYFLLNDISYDTGIPCSAGKTLKYVKKY